MDWWNQVVSNVAYFLHMLHIRQEYSFPGIEIVKALTWWEFSIGDKQFGKKITRFGVLTTSNRFNYVTIQYSYVADMPK